MVLSSGVPDTSASASLTSFVHAFVVEVVIDLSAVSISFTIFEFAFVNLTTDPAFSADSVLFVVSVDLSVVRFKAELVSSVHDLKGVVKFHFLAVDP